MLAARTELEVRAAMTLDKAMEQLEKYGDALEEAQAKRIDTLKDLLDATRCLI